MVWGKKSGQGGSMSKAEKAEMYREFLQGEGYAPKIDGDGDIIFKREGRTYVIIIDEKDEMFFRIVFPNFWSIDSEEERRKVYEAAVYATAETKVAKVFPVGDNVWATVELFCSPPVAFQLVFERSLGAVMSSVRVFTDKMRE